jgi:PTH1 family peptidyl-tRNA hydrolase
MPEPLTLLIGLGNPTAHYATHRHNIGAMLLAQIAEKYSFPRWQNKFKGLWSAGTLGDTPVGLLFPQTYMNLSGESVLAAVQFFKTPIENIWVLHDDLDVPLGKIKIKQGGGHGGHNGLRSIDALVGQNYHRLRLGISHPGHRDLVTQHVLSPFQKDEWEIVERVLDGVTDNVEALLRGEKTTL